MISVTWDVTFLIGCNVIFHVSRFVNLLTLLQLNISLLFYLKLLMASVSFDVSSLVLWVVTPTNARSVKMTHHLTLYSPKLQESVRQLRPFARDNEANFLSWWIIVLYISAELYSHQRIPNEDEWHSGPWCPVFLRAQYEPGQGAPLHEFRQVRAAGPRPDRSTAASESKHASTLLARHVNKRPGWIFLHSCCLREQQLKLMLFMLFLYHLVFPVVNKHGGWFFLQL